MQCAPILLRERDYSKLSLAGYAHAAAVRERPHCDRIHIRDLWRLDVWRHNSADYVSCDI